uniref:Uncharacterized protein n=1 Tax=Cyriopagopus schmidti TaxID=29017 RepID=B5M6E2_CYRSC|nr:unknown [Cyriopagopus schmidti]
MSITSQFSDKIPSHCQHLSPSISLSPFPLALYSIKYHEFEDFCTVFTVFDCSSG